MVLTSLIDKAPYSARTISSQTMNDAIDPIGSDSVIQLDVLPRPGQGRHPINPWDHRPAFCRAALIGIVFGGRTVVFRVGASGLRRGEISSCTLLWFDPSHPAPPNKAGANKRG